MNFVFLSTDVNSEDFSFLSFDCDLGVILISVPVGSCYPFDRAQIFASMATVDLKESVQS